MPLLVVSTWVLGLVLIRFLLLRRWKEGRLSARWVAVVFGLATAVLPVALVATGGGTSSPLVVALLGCFGFVGGFLGATIMFQIAAGRQ